MARAQRGPLGGVIADYGYSPADFFQALADGTVKKRRR